MKQALMLSLLLAMPCWAQSPSGKAETKGSCSPAVTGSKNTFTIRCGIDKKQGQEMINILNRILANQIDPNVVMTKLDEILKGLNPNLPKTTYSCRGQRTTQGSTPNTGLQINMSVGEDPALQQMIKLSDAEQNEELLKSCTLQIDSKPEWLTPRLFCGIAYSRRGDKAKAKDMFDVYDSRKGPAYDDDSFCRQLSDLVHSQLN